MENAGAPSRTIAQANCASRAAMTVSSGIRPSANGEVDVALGPVAIVAGDDVPHDHVAPWRELGRDDADNRLGILRRDTRRHLDRATVGFHQYESRELR